MSYSLEQPDLTDEPKVVVEKVKIKPTDYGFGTRLNLEGNQEIEVKRVTMPIEHNGEHYAVSALVYDVPEPPGSLETDKPILTIITWGGGGSEETSNAHYLGSLPAGLNKTDAATRPYRIRIISMPHIMGSAKTADLPQGKSFETTTAVTMKALATPELGVTEQVVLFGFSAGGAQGIELAAQMGDKVKCLVLSDPAGIHENPDMVKNIVLDSSRSFPDYYEEAKKEGKKGLEAITHAVKNSYAEFLATMATPEGVPKNWRELVKMMAGGAQAKHIERIGSLVGLENPVAPGIDVVSLGKDSTAEARAEIRCPVIFAPQMGAQGVNVLWDTLKGTIQSYMPTYKLEDFRELLTRREESTDDIDKGIAHLVEEKLQELFPNTKVIFMPQPSSSHNRPFIGDNKYFDRVMMAVDNFLKRPPAKDREVINYPVGL